VSVQTASPTPATLRWPRSRVVLYVALPRKPADLQLGELQEAVGRALADWCAACVDCSFPQVTVRSLGEWRGAQIDGMNVVAFQSGAWCPAKAETDCYDPGRAAITQQHSALDGAPDALGEADIEINAANFKWSLDGGAPGTVSLRAVLTHELGHFLGLPHWN